MTTRTKTRKPQNELDSARIGFNHGYWDARDERESGRPRLPVPYGPQTTSKVSREFSPFYYDGYVAGLASDPADPATSSTGPWLAYLAGKTDAEREEIRRQIYEAHAAGAAKNLRMKRSDPYIIAQARERTEMSMTG